MREREEEVISDTPSEMLKILGSDQLKAAPKGALRGCTVVAMLWVDPTTGEGTWTVSHAQACGLRASGGDLLRDAAKVINDRANETR